MSNVRPCHIGKQAMGQRRHEALHQCGAGCAPERAYRTSGEAVASGRVAVGYRRATGATRLQRFAQR